MILIEEGVELKPHHLKICDFGLVMKQGDTKCIYKRCGTPGFVPPEIILVNNNEFDKVVSIKWDTFSVGVILFMLISRSILY